MTEQKKRIAVLGAGPMGLACAYKLAKSGHSVTLYEAAPRIGGMTISFDFDGLNIERFYHFICKTDYAYFELLKDLNIYDKLRWTNTRMGFYYKGKLYEWGHPIALLMFPALDLISKIRYGLNVLYTKSIKNWEPYDNVEASAWLKKWLGEKGFNVLWRRLFELKFFEYSNNLSASWIAARIQRTAMSRDSIFKESLGYLDGGSDTLLFKLDEKLRALGVDIRLSSPVERIIVDKEGNTKGVSVHGEFFSHDTVISTIPLPYLSNIVPDLPDDEMEKIKNIVNIGVVTVKVKMSKPLTPYFWLNITDDRIDIPGIIEYTNLNPLPVCVAYVPYYMPQAHEKYRWPDEMFQKETIDNFKKINPEFSEECILGFHVSRYRYAQTICEPGFSQKLPPMKSKISGFFMADTSYYYPNDRSIDESLRTGQQLANLASKDLLSPTLKTNPSDIRRTSMERTDA